MIQPFLLFFSEPCEQLFYTKILYIMLRRLPALLLPIVFSFYSYAQDACAPVGWATQNGGTTGGGSSVPVTVSTLADLQTQASATGARVIYVSGSMGAGVGTRVRVSANKTIIGLPGARLIGGFDVRSASNVIIRNMKIQGPGAVDVNGVDCITIDASTNVWIDHCEIYDGQDGNLDISNGANFISITWCKFYYTSASTNHQFCNLIGNSDSRTTDRGRLKVTMMYNWFAQGVRERMPRVRYGQVHVVNNYFNSTGNNHCVRAGREADLLVESNSFEGVRTPIDLFNNDFTAVTSRNNLLVATTGNATGSGTAFTPPYSLTIAPAANVKSLVTNATCGAGATMSAPTSCGCGTVVTYTLTAAASPAAGGTVTGAGIYNSGAVATLTAVPAAGYTFTGWSGDASGTSATTTVTMNGNKSVTANFQPVVTNFTLTAAANPSAGGSVTGAGTYASGTVVTLTASPAAGYTFTGWSGDASGTSSSTTVTMNSNKSVTANFQPIAVSYSLTTVAIPSAGGTVSGAGNYNSGTVVTITATPAAGYTFTGWSGDASGTSSTTTVTMNSNKTVTANFQAVVTNYTLSATANPVNGGTVSGAGTYASGTAVTVTATPAAGYIFTGWSGDASGSSSSTTVTMNSNKSVVANFSLSGGGGTTTVRIEDATTGTAGLCLVEGTISSNSGANNGRVINLTNSTGRGANWRVSVPAAGTYSLNWRYVNSSSSNTYSMRFLLNGVLVNGTLPFPRTSGSTVFSNTTTTVTLNAGVNTIRLESSASNATADIDWMEITGASPAVASCTAARPVPVATLMQPSGVYPNPAHQSATLRYTLREAQQVSIRILAADGRMVQKPVQRFAPAGVFIQDLSLARLAPGAYRVILSGSNSLREVFTLLIH